MGAILQIDLAPAFQNQKQSRVFLLFLLLVSAATELVYHHRSKTRGKAAKNCLCGQKTTTIAQGEILKPAD